MDLLHSLKEKLKTTFWKIVLGISLVIIGLLIYFKLLGYLMAILLFAGFFYLTKQGKEEGKQLVSPWKREQQQKEVEDLQTKISIVEQHIEENPGDLEAKLQLKELQDELISLIEKYNLS